MTKANLSGARRRGFILLVMVGLMAVILILCTGFLSFTRSEMTYVSGLRNQTECNNALASALDFVSGAIVKDTFNGNQFDDGKAVAIARDPGSAFHRWWYKPSIEMKQGSLGSIEDEAGWFYLPANFTTDGTTRVRVRVQVSDTNGSINVNDAIDDGIPTQAQLACMLCEACDYSFAERERAAKLTIYSASAPFNGGSILHYSKYAGYNCPGNGHAGFNPAAPAAKCPYHAYPLEPRRYLDGWRAASRTISNIDHSYKNYYKWRTTNEPYFTDIAIPGGSKSVTLETIFSASQSEHGISGDFAGGDIGYYLFQEGRYAVYNACYVDPDTGRSPVNVNTGVPPGTYTPGTTWNNVGLENYYTFVHFDRVMKGVFNVASLKHLIRIGTFPFLRGGVTHRIQAKWLYEQPLSNVEPAAAPLDTWTPDEIEAARKKAEEYRCKVAYQYQETLVRYFAGMYDNYATWYSGNYPYTAPGYTSKWHNYQQRYGATLGAANTGTGQVKYFCPGLRLDKPRFPFGLDEFRANIKADLTAMTVHSRNAAFNDGTPAATESESGYVSIDDSEVFEIAPGKLDRRVATAIYDNAVPGSATLWNAVEAGKYPLTPEERYPIRQLYEMRLGRDENTAVWHEFPQREGEGTIPVGVYTPASDGFPKKVTKEMGRIIALSGAPGAGTAGQELGPWEIRNHVPERQLLFTADCFSTELTTTTTTYAMVVAAQLVDPSKSLAQPDILFSRHVAYVVELAPDVKNETGGATDWSSTGLGYYKTARPRARVTDANYTDDNLATPPLVRTDRNGNAIRGTDTSAALEWFDYRGVPKGQEDAFYDTAWQTRRRFQIRRVVDFSFNE
ncbi:MAG: hypothetical protein KIS92_02075 [Planctomycetota bacterium]|nr:hypothetical protein [Planctomycetota bacterium]